MKEMKEEKWISVNDKQPEKTSKEYLCTNKYGGIGVYTYTQFADGRAWTDGSNKADVIAWQPLPEPFKTVKMSIETKSVPQTFITVNGIELPHCDVQDAVEKFEEDNEWHYSYFEYNSSIDKLVDAGVIKVKYGERQCTIYTKNEYTDDFIKEFKILRNKNNEIDD